jgi:predicted HTH transcriptional regulator
MKQTTAEKIIEYINNFGRATGKELSDAIPAITSRAIRKQLKSMLEKNILEKIGKPPKVYYLIATSKNVPNPVLINKSAMALINDRYLYISPAGEMKEGLEGFVMWCEHTRQDIKNTSIKYLETIKKYDQFKKNSLIDGMPKMKSTFDPVFVDKLFYLDFYSIERFGKTKLGQMLLYSKQSQNKALIQKLIATIRPKIIKVIEDYNIDGVLFIPPTVKREIQFMKELEKFLKLPIKRISVTKIKTEIIIPQKTLSKLEDRVENAKRTIMVDDFDLYTNILIIDDAVGSGATLNETAKQIKDKHIVRGDIIGLAITGSFKGFDIISEV